jgi:hypothetical protein
MIRDKYKICETIRASNFCCAGNRLPMGSGKTTFKKTEVARIVEGVKKSGVRGTFEFQLEKGLVRFEMAESDSGPAKIDDKPNPWDKVLNNGKAKPALTLCKKVP